MFPICLLHTAGLRNSHTNDTSSALKLFLREHGCSSWAHVFHVCGFFSGAGAILELKKLGPSLRGRGKIRGSDQGHNWQRIKGASRSPGKLNAKTGPRLVDTFIFIFLGCFFFSLRGVILASINIHDIQ